MLIIGITGGVGAGKSEILKHLMKNERYLVRKADEISHNLMERGEPLFDEITDVLGKDVIGRDGSIDRGKMAGRIFNDPVLKDRINDLIHPAVNAFIEKDIKEAASSGKYDIYFLEAALLIECGYGKICDELWYIYADEDVRRQRLKRDRGYSDEKTDAIMKSQLPDMVFRENCRRIIDNSGDIEKSIQDLDRLLSGYTG